MPLAFRRNLLTSAWIGLGLIVLSTASLAQYRKTNLVSNLPTGAKHQDTQLQNAWGLAYAPGNPFWISDQYSGLSTLYDGSGVKLSLIVTIPSASGTGTGSVGRSVADRICSFVSILFLLVAVGECLRITRPA